MPSAPNLAVAGRASSGQAEDRILHPGISLRRWRRRQRRGALSWAKGGEAGALCTPQAPQPRRRGRRRRRRRRRRLRRGRAAAGGPGSGGGRVGAIVGAAAAVGRSPKGANPSQSVASLRSQLQSACNIPGRCGATWTRSFASSASARPTRASRVQTRPSASVATRSGCAAPLWVISHNLLP